MRRILIHACILASCDKQRNTAHFTTM
jgi:hypothetical protein